MKNFNVTSMLVMLMFMCITSMQAQSITPSKKYITKELNNVSNFSSIRVLGSPDVEYRQNSDSKTTVSIYGSDNLVDLLEVSTVNGVLQVNIKKGVKILSGERRLKVIASSPSLDDVDIKGSADVYLKGTLKGADLNLNITGSGDIEAENLQYTNLSAFIKGSGDIDVKNVKATTVKTIVSGSGDVKMKGSKSLGKEKSQYGKTYSLFWMRKLVIHAFFIFNHGKGIYFFCTFAPDLKISYS